MTARSTNPKSIARSEKRESTTPQTKRKVRGNNNGRGVGAARTHGTDTSNLSAEEMAEVISPDKPLTEKQKLFVKNWAEGDSLSSAALRAGYAGSNASLCYRMAKMPNVLALKAEYELKWEQDNQMSRRRVMDGMLEAIEMAKLMAEPATMIQGWKTIGQLCGYFAPVQHQVKVDVTGNVIIDKLNSMSDAELLKIISGGPKSADLLGYTP